MGDVKEQIMSCFKTKDYSQPKLVQTVYGGGKKPRKVKKNKRQSEDIIKKIRNIFNQKKKKIK